MTFSTYRKLPENTYAENDESCKLEMKQKLNISTEKFKLLENEQTE